MAPTLPIIFSRDSSLSSRGSDLGFETHSIGKSVITAIAVGATFLFLAAVGLGVLIFFWRRYWKQPELAHIGPGAPATFSSTVDIEKASGAASAGSTSSDEVVVIPAPKEVESSTNEKDIEPRRPPLTVQIHPPPSRSALPHSTSMLTPPSPSVSPVSPVSPSLSSKIKRKSRVDDIREAEETKRSSYSSETSSLDTYVPPTPQDLKFV